MLISFLHYRFKEWQQQNKLQIPRIGEEELPNANINVKRYRHNKIMAPKPLDPLSKDYEKKLKKKSSGYSSDQEKNHNLSSKNRHVNKKINNELKTVDQIRKQKRLKEKRRAKNARPSRKRKLKKK